MFARRRASPIWSSSYSATPTSHTIGNTETTLESPEFTVVDSDRFRENAHETPPRRLAADLVFSGSRVLPGEQLAFPDGGLGEGRGRNSGNHSPATRFAHA